MRSSEEQMREILRRKDIYTKAKIIRKKMIAEISTALVCLVLMITVACFLPKLDLIREQAPILQYGSMIEALPLIGYIIIAILAFAMGIAVTLACVHWQEHKKKEQEI